jgi:hypothetical protein
MYNYLKMLVVYYYINWIYKWLRPCRICVHFFRHILLQMLRWFT